MNCLVFPLLNAGERVRVKPPYLSGHLTGHVVGVCLREVEPGEFRPGYAVTLDDCWSSRIWCESHFVRRVIAEPSPN